MSDLNEDLSKKFINYLDTRQYSKLQFEIEKMGDVSKQNPLFIFYYACAIFLQISVNNSLEKNKKLLYASDLFEKVYGLDEKNLQSLYNMIAVSFKTKVFKNVLPLALKAYKKNKTNVVLIEGLARIHYFLGNTKDTIKFFKILYGILPEKIEWRLLFIGSLNYESGILQKEYLNECLKLYSLLEKKFSLENNNFEFNPKKNNKIKLSFLSGDFKTHSVSFFLKGLLEKIDHSIFEVHMISNLKVLDQDNMTKELKRSAFKWHDIESYSDTDLVKYLRSLNLDILIDLSGFTNGNRLVALACRCAKAQIGWLGYNNSLGIKNLDYLISDKNLIKPNELELYSENILFLPKIWNALPLPQILPNIKKQTGMKDKQFTFCSFNSFKKLSDKTIEVWSEILKKTNSQILLKSSSVGGNDLKDNILKKFTDYDVKQSQIIFLKKEKNIYDHLELYNLADVALDTFPYPGVTTSFEAILMGLPVLTMRGFNFNSRCGESINNNLGTDWMIAKDENDYVSKAISLKENKNLNNIYGIKLREKAISSTLFDVDTFARDFQTLIKKVYNQN